MEVTFKSNDAQLWYSVSYQKRTSNSTCRKWQRHENFGRFLDESNPRWPQRIQFSHNATSNIFWPENMVTLSRLCNLQYAMLNARTWHVTIIEFMEE